MDLDNKTGVFTGSLLLVFIFVVMTTLFYQGVVDVGYEQFIRVKSKHETGKPKLRYIVYGPTWSRIKNDGRGK